MTVAAWAIALSSVAASSVAVQLAGQDTATQLYRQSQAEGVLKDVMSLTPGNVTGHDASNVSAPNVTSQEKVVRQALQGEVIIYIGDSATSNTVCVTTTQLVTCDPDAGDKGNRVNTHIGYADDDFTITVNGYEVCATRDDFNGGWGMRLEIACSELSATSPPTASPTTESPTMSPTESPTASPTMPPPESSTVAMYGDPHARNIHGQKFDLHGVENATLLRIPRATETFNNTALLKVDAKMKTVAGGLCKNGLYMDTITIKGKWAEVAEAKPNSGNYVVVANAEKAVPTHRHHKRVWRLGPNKIFLMVAHGMTDTGITYLNFRAGKLDKVGMNIGGLLGDDGADQQFKSDVDKQDDGCMSLLQVRLNDDKVAVTGQ